MGLLQKALETYENHEHLVGKQISNHAVLAPVAHTVTSASIIITVDAEGNFVSAQTVEKDAEKIIIPVTEESAGRTSAPRAHPLCEQLGYLAPRNPGKYTLYLDQLSDWANSEYTHPKLMPILNYVKSGSILSDLEFSGILAPDGRDFAKHEKDLIAWNVLGDLPTECYGDLSLQNAFIRYYENKRSGESSGFCYVSGKTEPPATQHPKGIISINGNAKLISANDNIGFTYRGRFEDDGQALEIGYTASQKAHNALRWLAAEQGIPFGGRTFICWNPAGKSVQRADLPFGEFDDPPKDPSDFRDRLKKTLEGKKSDLPLEEDVVIAAFDAATAGRLALTYYNELRGSDFLERLYDWDLHCSWFTRYKTVESPRLSQIVNCAYGTEQENRLKTDDRVLRQQIQRLISCRIDGAPLPQDLVKALADRASRPSAFDSQYETVLATACAVVRKYRHDIYKEDFEMAIEPEKADRSYQFGRLLAVLEKVERSTYSRDEGREPQAIRMQETFCKRPMYAASIIEKQLARAYFPRLSPGSRAFYKGLISEIMEKISTFPEAEWNRPLDHTYLMGYYLQRKEFYTAKNNNTEEDNNEYSEE